MLTEAYAAVLSVIPGRKTGPGLKTCIWRVKGTAQLFSGVPALEKEIDELVYQLYDLTPEEIALVEGKQ